MQDFDVERQKRADEDDRLFKIGGEEFRHRASVAPEKIMAWMELGERGSVEKQRLESAQKALEAAQAQDMAAEHIERLAERVAGFAEEAKAASVPEGQWVSILDDTILSLIEPDYHDAWRRVRDQDAVFPLSIGDMTEVLDWLVKKVVARPTQSPSDSLRSPAGNGTASTVVSSLPEVAA
jgi:hypothetical protein